MVTGGIAIAAIASLCCIMVWPIRIRYREWDWGQQGSQACGLDYREPRVLRQPGLKSKRPQLRSPVLWQGWQRGPSRWAHRAGPPSRSAAPGLRLPEPSQSAGSSAGTPWLTEGRQGLLHVPVATRGGRGWDGVPLAKPAPQVLVTVPAQQLPLCPALDWGRGQTPPCHPGDVLGPLMAVAGESRRSGPAHGGSAQPLGWLLMCPFPSFPQTVRACGG